MAENIMDLSVTRGGRVSIVADAVPADAVEGNVYGRSHAPEDALVSMPRCSALSFTSLSNFP